ncbi:MAG TPA: ATP-dependent helicase [Chthoniobacteraceae bacterium]|nr:ATP-dependent helicase [Chthoniobacteraceae bacterium]
MARQYILHRAAPAAPSIDYAAELNPQQFAAVTAPPGPALVIAGAGSGKTRTLTYRVAYLLENGYAPSEILLLTFTNKAAREMLERVDALLPDRTAGLWGGTFHSIGNRILRYHAAAAGFAPGFSIMDREDQADLLASVIVAAGVNPKEKRFPKPAVVGDIVSFVLNTAQPLEAVLEEKYPYFIEFEEELKKIFALYAGRKKAANSLDFDDLLTQPLRLLKNDPEIAARYRSQFRVILVDEYQDTNQLQADFIDALACEHRNVMVVGDDAQSIYSWRGANFRNILHFPERYPGATVYKIETNYRSIPEVLEVANAAIAANTGQFPKQLQPARAASGVKPALVPALSGKEQALFVAQRLLELRDQGIDLNQIAVLYRAHFHSMEVQMELTRHGIPFFITSGIRFFEQAHVKDVAAFLKFALNPRDEIAFKRMARLLPGIGQRSAEKLWGLVEEALRENVGGTPSFRDLLLPLKVPTKARRDWEQLAHTLAEIAPGGDVALPPAAMIDRVLEALYDDYLKTRFPNYESRREDLNTLAHFARQYENTADFLTQLALQTTLDDEPGAASTFDDERVTLSSVHQAKGLEWRVVFVIGLAEGMFPGARSLEDEEAIEEERRLFYVAITRAEDELYLTYPLLRLNAGYGEMNQRPSRFLGEIPTTTLEEWQISADPYSGDPF